MLTQDKILLFGDSITQFSCNQDDGFGLAPALQNLYMRRLDVVVRGFSGYTTQTAKYIIDPILEAEHLPHSKVRLCVVFFGSNDSCTPDSPQHVDILTYKENIRSITQTLLAKDIKVILVTPGLLDETRKLSEDEPSYRSLDRFREYGREVIDVSRQLNVPCIDLFETFALSVNGNLNEPLPGRQGGPLIKHLVPDTLHFSGEAYRIYYNILVATINASFPDLQADELPLMLPEWRDLDLSKPPKLPSPN